MPIREEAIPQEARHGEQRNVVLRASLLGALEGLVLVIPAYLAQIFYMGPPIAVVLWLLPARPGYLDDAVTVWLWTSFFASTLAVPGFAIFRGRAARDRLKRKT